MNYEDAFELKNAGFLFNWIDSFGHDWTDGCTYHGTGAVMDIAMCTCRVPTLSELIEACGEGFEGIYPPWVRDIGSWRAFGPVKWEKEPLQKDTVAHEWISPEKPYMNSYTQDGSTPEQAVKNLWLALNKK